MKEKQIMNNLIKLKTILKKKQMLGSADTFKQQL